MKNLQIREMTEDDLGAVALLEKECFSTPWSYESLHESLNNPDYTFLVAVVDENVAGYAGLVRCMDEADITDICVSSIYRRKGIAKALMLGVFEKARTLLVNKIYLEVRQSNEGAIALYEAVGFKRDGIRKNFYEQPTENAVLMSVCLQLSEE